MFFIVDKPVGPSCNQILSHFKRRYQTKKAGHIGTLDPKASGLLLIATEGSTKLIPYLENKNKVYEFEFDITKTSPSLDTDTPSIEWKGDKEWLKNHCTQEEVTRVCHKFLGEQLQTPPAYSAIWIDGKRSYSIVREKQVADASSKQSGSHLREFLLHEKKRKISITGIDILKIDFPYITLRAKVSSGTYIRSLALDIGISLGGTALITQLRRVGYHNFTLSENTINNQIRLESHTFHTNEYTKLAQVEYAFLFPEFTFISISLETYTELQRGKSIRIPTNTLDDTTRLVICIYQNQPVSLCRCVSKGRETELQIIKNEI